MMMLRAVRSSGKFVPVIRSRALASLSSVVNEANVLDGTLDTSSDFYKVRNCRYMPEWHFAFSDVWVRRCTGSISL